jgi:hypothetical protein
MARECIFCGKPAKSKEDIWPCWLTQSFIAPGSMEMEVGRELQMKKWRVNRPHIAVKCVCGVCNNGWISGSQTRAKRIIERLWDQAEATLDLHACKSLSLWAVMTSMTLQTFDEQNKWLYSEEERTLMWHEQRIPSCIGIWTANCIGRTETYSVGRSMTGTAQDTQRQARASAVTMAFGNLGIQVLKVNPDGDTRGLKEITVGQGWGDWENIAVQIWPLKGDPVDWPPPRGIRCEEELEIFAGRFRSQPDFATTESPSPTD